MEGRVGEAAVSTASLRGMVSGGGTLQDRCLRPRRLIICPTPRASGFSRLERSVFWNLRFQVLPGGAVFCLLRFWPCDIRFWPVCWGINLTLAPLYYFYCLKSYKMKGID